MPAVVIVNFVQRALALILFTGLGVLGAFSPSGVVVRAYGITVETEAVPPFAIGGIAYHNASRTSLKHEYGHLVHEHELGGLYVPIAGLTSLVGNTLGLLGIIDAAAYYSMWTERMADEYGGVTR